MSRYEGLVVGGPLAGKMLGSDHPTFEVVGEPKVINYWTLQGATTLITPTWGRIVTYRHVEVMHLGFWVPDEHFGDAIRFILSQMAAVYVQNGGST